MFFRRKQSTEKWLEKFGYKLQYEQAIERLYQYGRTTLAIARIGYWEGYNVKGHFSGEPMPSPAHFMMNGVVHELTMHAKRIWCEVRFNEEQPTERGIGSCLLAHFDDLKTNQKLPREKQPLLLKVWISDPGMEWRRRAYETVRDAAASDAQFCHFDIGTEKLDPAAALSSVRENGYGPSMNVISFAMSRQIILPKAPEWGWKP